ncbi:DERA protein [Baffinella frigidus]|nr:DERA protein [Cryptophyta sp. CCMP2293]
MAVEKDSLWAAGGGGEPAGHDGRNPGMPLDMVRARLPVNRAAVQRRVASMVTRRSVKGDQQAAWLLRAVTCIDLTTLGGDDTPGTVQRLCAKARQPVRDDILEKLGAENLKIRTGAVCVYPDRVAEAKLYLAGTGIPVASVATGFPAGQIKHEHKLAEIRQAVADGADEIDIVIPRKHALCGADKIHIVIPRKHALCGLAHLKTILATGELPTLEEVYTASMICMMAGADFIKTSTGKEKVNATLEVSLIMCRAIRDYHEATGVRIGFKPAGGIRTAKDAISYFVLMKEELGQEWLDASLFRLGASTLLTDCERQLHHSAFGSYAGAHYMPLP